MKLWPTKLWPTKLWEEPPIIPDDLAEKLERVAQAQLIKQYRDGLKDGTKIALNLLLDVPGEQHGGIPYRGPLDPAAREWAQAALNRIAALEQEEKSSHIESTIVDSPSQRREP